MFYEIKQFFRRILHVLRWIPVLWKDQDWDQSWMFTIWAYKLERMQVEHENDTWHSSAARVARQIQICKFLLRRLAGGKYHEKAYEDHFDKWPCRFTKTEDGGWTCFETSDAERQEMKRLFEEEAALYQADLELFWKIFSKYHRGWWT